MIGSSDTTLPIETFVALPKRYDFDETLRFQRFGPGDPTTRRAPGEFWKAARTPDGPVTLHLARPRGAPHVVARAWGTGASWTLDRVPALLGVADRPGDFLPPGPVAPFARRHAGLHLARSPWPFNALCAAILQQRVRFFEAAAAHALLVRAGSEPAPGGGVGLFLPADPARLRGVPEELWVRAGVEPRRVATLMRAARACRKVDDAFQLPAYSARTLLQHIQGCGPWTVEMTMGFGLGDADAVPVGDVHLPGLVGWALAGEADADDQRMIELLGPFRPHRFRVIRILLAENIAVPRRAPRAGAGWASRRRRRW